MDMESVAPHVLALDDDPDVRKVLVQYLSAQDLRITAVASGREMLQVIESEPVDLLMIDLRLSGEDGLTLARRVRETSAIPILILSGKAEEADLVMGLELAADDYVTKPFRLRELLARIRAVLRRSQVIESSAPARRTAARVSIRRLGAQPATASADLTRRAARRAHQQRVQPAVRVSLGASARSDARSAAGALARARARGVRPRDRRHDAAAAAQDRARSIQSRAAAHRARRRLRLRGTPVSAMRMSVAVAMARRQSEIVPEDCASVQLLRGGACRPLSTETAP